MAEKLDTVQRRALERAASILGGKEKLREYLRVPMHRLDAWLEGRDPLPMGVFLRAIDAFTPPHDAIPVLQRARELRDRSAAVLGKSQRTMMQAQVARANAAAARRAMSDASRSETILQMALDAAMKASQADMGNVQLAGADGLRIVAERGFRHEFLDFFARVDDATSACGRALRDGRSIVVEDVARDPAFAGTEALLVVQAAGVIAVQSTPLVGPSGRILGVLSTHYRAPGGPRHKELACIAAIASDAAAALETIV